MAKQSVDLSLMSNLRIFLEGVDDSTRPSQRLDHFSVGVDVAFGVVALELDLGRYERSRTRIARLLVFLVRPTTFPVTITKELEDGILTFSQHLLFSKKQVMENCNRAALEVS